METAAAVASSAGPPGAVPVVLAPPTSLLSYNISLNFSSILAMFPTTDFFARIRRGIYWNGMDQAQFASPSAGIDWSLDTPNHSELEATAKAASMDAFPGPWAFFTSWYMMGLFIMAVLLHRIQNVIIPSRMPHHRRQRHAYRFGPNFAPRYQNLRWLYDLILPLDFSRTTTRFILHLPSAYFLSKMLVVWFLLVLQTSEILPSWNALGWLHNLVQWSSEKDMNDVCWHTFSAVCSAFLVEGFVKALDGMGTGFPIGSANPNTSPFNLVGYAFLLHVYSSPQTHSYKPLDEGPSRPDKHVLITITIPLLQLTIFHLLSISKRLSTHRLIPTALSSMFSLLHFHGTLFSHYRRSHFGTVPPPPTPTSGRPTSHVNYPLLNYIPNFFETLLICTILLTLFLNAFAQLLVRGRIDRVFSQLGIGYGSSLHDDENGSQGFFASLPLDEDFGVLLLRVGIASLEATGLKGWGNEVAPIPLPVKIRKGRRSISLSTASPIHGTVRMGRAGVSNVRYGIVASSSPGPSSLRSPRMAVDNIFSDYSESRRLRKGKGAQTQYRRGFNNEVRTVDLGNTEAAARGSSVQWWRWLRELYAYLTTLWGVIRGLVVFLLERARGRVRISESVRKGGRESVAKQEGDKERGVDMAPSENQEGRDRALYERFVRGEDISDDDDDEHTISDSDDIHGESDEDGEEDEDEDEGEAEAITLFTDFLRNGAASTSAVGSARGQGEMVLAHLVHGTEGGLSGPLTRRRWNTLFRQEGVAREHRLWDGSDREDGEDEVWDVPSGKQTVFDQDSDTEKSFMDACVICTSEKRDIICWPCRCLAMCDNCREALASKSSPTKHCCPCCRQSVEGYSKIYIP